MLWAFSIWLESVAILPQLFMLQRTGEAETITTHYLFALGAYRALYIPNWIYRYFVGDFIEPIAVLAGIVQTVLYSDFFYIYWTKYVPQMPCCSGLAIPSVLTEVFLGLCRARNSICQYKACFGADGGNIWRPGRRQRWMIASVLILVALHGVQRRCRGWLSDTLESRNQSMTTSIPHAPLQVRPGTLATFLTVFAPRVA